MSLRIEISKYRGHVFPKPSAVVFGREGGTVGRSNDNRLVLPDDCISRKHAQISYEDGRYYLFDNSSNGTLISNKDLFVQCDKVELSHGDILRIGDYELNVCIDESEDSPAKYADTPSHGFLSLTELEAYQGSGPSSGRVLKGGQEDQSALLVQQLLSIDDFFKDVDEDSIVPEPAGQAALPGVVSDIEAAEPKEVSGPAPARGEGMSTPAGPDTRVGEQCAYAVDPETRRRLAEEVSCELLQCFLKGARIEDKGLLQGPEVPRIMECLGTVFREMAQGLWTVLRGRTELKAEIRLPMTMVRPSCNNPLKLSPTIEDAIRHLVKRCHPSYMEPIEAVREGFEDVMNHQVAMNAGIQASLMDALEKFNPDHFSEKTKEGFFQRKGKCWETYCQAFCEVKDEAAEGIFGKAFVRAYEQQLDKLRSKKK